MGWGNTGGLLLGSEFVGLREACEGEVGLSGK